MPHIKIINNNTTTVNLNDIIIEYYIYEPNLSVSSLSWRNDWCKVGSNNNATSAYSVSFSRLDTAYLDGDKKADIKVTISFANGYSLAPTEDAEILFAFYRNDWSYNFNEVAHWSWKSSSSFVEADSTILKSTEASCDAGECISRGILPPTVATSVSSVYPQDCGAGENMKFDGYIRNGKKGGTTIMGTISASDYSELSKRSLLFKVDPGSAITPTSRWITANYGLDGILIENIEYPQGRKAVSITKNGLSTNGAVICTEASVNGLLKAKEIRVTTKNWSDYVFEDNYKLKTLAETESFINTNGHLPNIPSAKEVAENGVSVGEMQAKLLAKVEELTLHMISLSKKNSELEEQIKVLTAKESK